MNGKMRSFVEDTVISVVVIVVIAVVYYVVSNFIINEKNEVNESVQPITIEKQIEEPTIPQDINQTNPIDEQEKKVEIQSSFDEKLIRENTEKKIDIHKLKQFITTTENEIAQNINYNIDTNTTTQEEYLKIRLTLLKSGDYEQLTFVDGNEKLFEKNKKNITKIFPLKIDKDIIEEFPRYLRIELRKKF